MAIETVTTVNTNDDAVTEIRIPPNGTSHDLQREISMLLHRIALKTGKVTLANLGYLHINTLLYDKEAGTISLKVYFDAHYAARVRKDGANGSREIVIVEPMTMFENYLYVGDIFDVVTYEKILAPKSKMVEDEGGLASMHVKDDAKLVETNALVLNCNLPITLAAAFNISLADPNFDVSCETVGKGAKNSVKSIITTANMSEVPVSVRIQHSGDAPEYDPNDAVPYLIALNDRIMAAKETQERLKKDVRKKAKKKGEKQERKSSAGFNKYS